jgi:hypothetical protein
MGGQVVVYYVVLFITAIAAYWRGNVVDRTGICIAILGSAFTSAFSTVTIWGDFAYPFFIIDLGVLIGFWSLALFSSRFWPYWATGWQLVGTLVHVQRWLFNDILEKPYGLLSMYIAYPILGVILVASLMKDRVSTNSHIESVILDRVS